MSWIEIHIKTSAERANLLSDQLSLLGAQAVSFLDAGDQPIYEPSPDHPRLWPETILVGLFESHHPIQDVLVFLEQQQANGFLDYFHLKHLEDQDWQRICLDSFKPVSFGKRLWICPSWHTPPVTDAVNVLLDPGLAFGTGSHPTTTLCLNWLDEHILGNEELIIDYGCGSGILAIAALKLGAKKVIAVDNDPQALEATRANAERNHISDTALETFLPQDLPKNLQADVLIANILSGPLIELAPALSLLIKPYGKIVLSGILIDQSLQVIKAYQPYFSIQDPAYHGEWIRLTGDKQLNVFK